MNPVPHILPPTRRRAGSTLLVVFFVLGILSMVVLSAGFVVKYDVRAIVESRIAFRAEQFAESGVAIAMNPTVEKDDPLLFGEGVYISDDPTEGFQVRIKSEGSRINLNSVLLRDDRELLRNLFTDWWGIDESIARDAADALKDWVDKDSSLSLSGAEKDYYDSMGRPEYPFNRPFETLDEVLFVRGMEEILAGQPGWRNLFTLWSSGTVDAADASPEVLAIVCEISLAEAESFVAMRDGADGIPGNDDDQIPESIEQIMNELGVPGGSREQVAARLGTGDKTLRIENTGFVGDYGTRISVVVRNRERQPLLLHRETGPYSPDEETPLP